jgi:SAM-dependent methyltransferase
LIDVIEHVQNPEEVLNQIYDALDSDGYLLVITPRRDSFFRFILGFNWWHYRVAHVGYFSKKNLIEILKNSGFDIIEYKYATWFLPLDYIFNRILKYTPFIKYKFNFSKEISIPINLLDSSMILVKKSNKS